MSVYVHCRLKPLALPDEAIARHIVPIRHSSIAVEKQYYLQKKRQLKTHVACDEAKETQAMQFELDNELDKNRIAEIGSLQTKLASPYTQAQLRVLYPDMFNAAGGIRKTVVEVCCGTGDFLLNAAKQSPTTNFIGVDIAISCVQRGVKKAYERAAKNLWFYCGSGEDFFTHDFSKIPLDGVMVNFPDPWPKKRHFKRRVVTLRFVEQVASVLRKRGTFTTATDVPYLAAEHRRLLAAHAGFVEEANHNKDAEGGQLENASDEKQRAGGDESSNRLPLSYYDFASVYQRKNLYKSQKVYFTHHRKK